MALTEIPSELSSTPSIVDGGNATAITIGSDESVALGGTLSLPNANATNEISFTGTEFTNVLSATTSGFQLGTTGAGYLAFLTNNAEAFRLTAARDMYFGQTTGSAASVGHIMQANGKLYNTADGGTVQYLRRLNSDGAIVEFNRDGTAVGRIGATAYDLFIASSGSGHNGLRFHDNGILPTNNTGALIDADCDIGISTYRFKDIYLSGGVNFSANANAAGMTSELLDGYEEGTWTPACSISALSVSRARYVRIGGVVHLSCTITTSGTMSTGTFQLTGLPYTGINNAHEDIGSVMSHNVGFGGYNQMVSYKYSGSGAIQFYLIKDNAAWALLQGQTGINTSEHIIMSITYKVF